MRGHDPHKPKPRARKRLEGEGSPSNHDDLLAGSRELISKLLLSHPIPRPEEILSLVVGGGIKRAAYIARNTERGILKIEDNGPDGNRWMRIPLNPEVAESVIFIKGINLSYTDESIYIPTFSSYGDTLDIETWLGRTYVQHERTTGHLKLAIIPLDSSADSGKEQGNNHDSPASALSFLLQSIVESPDVHRGLRVYSNILEGDLDRNNPINIYLLELTEDIIKTLADLEEQNVRRSAETIVNQLNDIRFKFVVARALLNHLNDPDRADVVHTAMLGRLLQYLATDNADGIRSFITDISKEGVDLGRRAENSGMIQDANAMGDPANFEMMKVALHFFLVMKLARMLDSLLPEIVAEAIMPMDPTANNLSFTAASGGRVHYEAAREGDDPQVYGSGDLQSGQEVTVPVQDRMLTILVDDEGIVHITVKGPRRDQITKQSFPIIIDTATLVAAAKAPMCNPGKLITQQKFSNN